MIQVNTPKILQVDMSGLPKRWISIEKAITYYYKDMVLFELGNPVATIHGGLNRITSIPTILTTNSIIGIKRSIVKKSEIERIPTLTNEKLFERDKYICGYCGEFFHKKFLSRDHIHPVCQGGKNIWTNVVTSCIICNNRKGGRTLQQSKMALLYLPYVPDRYESFILAHGTRHILADQMEFLLRKVPNTSRLKLS
jgi:hypothetical protein